MMGGQNCGHSSHDPDQRDRVDIWSYDKILLAEQHWDRRRTGRGPLFAALGGRLQPTTSKAL